MSDTGKPTHEPTLSRKQARLLRLSARRSGMYDGDRWDFAPKQFRRLESLGLVREETPHNPVHKPRAVITAAGREVLAAWETANGRA